VSKSLSQLLSQRARVEPGLFFVFIST